MLEDAIKFALEAHLGQKLKNGKPFILHPLHVMGQVSGETEQVVAVLHDVIEDTDTTLESILEHFGAKVAYQVSLLTKGQDQDYWEYILAIGEQLIASKVKVADLRHNLDLTRNDEVVTSVKKLNLYLKALRYLEGRILAHQALC